LNCSMKVNSTPLGIFIMEMKLHCFHRNLSNTSIPLHFLSGQKIHHVCVEKIVRVAYYSILLPINSSSVRPLIKINRHPEIQEKRPHHVCVEKFVRVDCGDDCDDKFYLIWTFIK
jgi:hypothetical protein